MAVTDSISATSPPCRPPTDEAVGTTTEDIVLDVAEAASFLRLNQEVLRRWAREGRVPGSKIGRRWLFLRADLVDYIRSQQTKPTQTVCLSISAEKSGGSALPRHQVSEYSDLLGL